MCVELRLIENFYQILSTYITVQHHPHTHTHTHTHTDVVHGDLKDTLRVLYAISLPSDVTNSPRLQQDLEYRDIINNYYELFSRQQIICKKVCPMQESNLCVYCAIPTVPINVVMVTVLLILDMCYNYSYVVQYMHRRI